MFKSARARALLAASALLALLFVMSAVAAWRTREEHEVRQSLSIRASASIAMERARAELFYATTLASTSLISDNPGFFLELFAQQWQTVEDTLTTARQDLEATGDEEEVATFDVAYGWAQQFKERSQAGSAAILTAAKDKRIEIARQLQYDIQPLAQAAILQFSRIAERQRAVLEDERAAADEATSATMWIVIGTSTISFIAGSAALAFLTGSVLRPLASLQTKVRAITSGDLATEAEVSGPREVASLAHDFNEMVTARRRAEEALRHQAATDSLTGIYNHRALHKLLSREVDRSIQDGHPVAVLMMDMNGFKLFNDTYGHQEGDQVLVHVTKVLKEQMRSKDIVGRYGGDEFMAVLPETSRDEAIICANRILEAISKERVRPHQGGELPLAISIGLAVCPEDSIHKEELVAYADASLMEAKQTSGDNLVVAHRSHEDSAAKKHTPFGVLDALVRAVDRKDRYTRAHSQQNAEFAVELGKIIGLSEGAVNALRIAGLLHDVGKIGVPDDILRKPGLLTDEEREIMREHVTLSNLIVHGVPNLQDVSDAVYSHHERWDGKGYPRRLQGEAIPLAGRIMSIVDAYSAMILDRPYRKALTHEEAVAELRRHAASQFDPNLVEPFIALLEQKQLAAA